MLYHWGIWKYHVVLRMNRLLDSRYRGKSQAEALNTNDGAGCLLAKVYTRAQTRELLSGFSGHRFEFKQFGWRQLLLVPELDRLLRPVLTQTSRNIFARTMGWNLYATATKPR